MEEVTKLKQAEEGERDILFSKMIKAGKRIYYIDVKKDRRNEMYLTITENKKIGKGTAANGQVNFEKHKLFLYKEDFAKFRNGLEEALMFAGFNPNDDVYAAEDRGSDGNPPSGEAAFKFDIDF